MTDNRMSHGLHGVGGALTRLLRPEQHETMLVLDAMPVTPADVLGETDEYAPPVVPLAAGVGTALQRLLRPDCHAALSALDGYDVTVADLLEVPRDHDVPDEPRGDWRAA